METLDVSAEKAMDILKIPADQRVTFQEKINLANVCQRFFYKKYVFKFLKKA